MASPFQQQALQRKLIYLALILVLFTASFLWRRYFVEEKAKELGLLEQTRGEVELTGSLARLTLTGSRGLATSVLWVNALEKQKKNQWNELEVIIDSLTKLQPHFITPWQFQSWNLAYNVSVESDRVADKFFYVTRGINLLSKGERINNNHPDLRFFMGFYNQNKIYLSDETNVMRSLYQLSIIPPNERDPARFRGEDGRSINWAELQQFCEAHPQLVRRLREGIKRETRRDLRRQFTCERPEDLVQFLADNYRVPSLWEDAPLQTPGFWRKDPTPRKKPFQERFPMLPPKAGGEERPLSRVFDSTELTYDDDLDDSHDCHAISRAWYGYAQEPIPEPGDLPGSNKEAKDRIRERRPKQMTTVIFRNYPARAQSYIGERLQQEGWFDDETYLIPGWFDRRDDQTREVRIGPREGDWWAESVWKTSADMWKRHGIRNKLLFETDAEEKNMRDRATAYEKRHNLKPGQRVPERREETITDPEELEEYRANRFMAEYYFYLGISNFHHHYNKSLVEVKRETIKARKLFFKGDRLRLTGNPAEALEMYESPDAILAWRDKVLLENKDFRRDRNTQEESQDIQMNYLDLLYDQYGRSYRQYLGQQLAGAALAGQLADGGVRGALTSGWYPFYALTTGKYHPYLDADLIQGPFDRVDKEGEPLIGPDIVKQVEDRRSERMGRQSRKKAVAAAAAAAAAPTPPTGPGTEAPPVPRP